MLHILNVERTRNSKWDTIGRKQTLYTDRRNADYIYGTAERNEAQKMWIPFILDIQAVRQTDQWQQPTHPHSLVVLQVNYIQTLFLIHIQQASNTWTNTTAVQI